MVLGDNNTQDAEKHTGNIYEYIKKNDIAAAFRDALTDVFETVFAKLDHLIDLYAATAQPSLWTWDNTSRWDYDKWY